MGSRLVSLSMMYLDRLYPSAAYHCVTYGAIHITSPACTGFIPNNLLSFTAAVSGSAIERRTASMASAPFA